MSSLHFIPHFKWYHFVIKCRPITSHLPSFHNFIKKSSATFYQKHSTGENTGSSHPSESLRSKMTSNDWTKAQIFTKLVRSDGHLKSATFWLYDCPCEMELSTSFQSKMSKFQCLSHFFQKNQATDLLLFVLVRKGRKVGARIKQQWDSWKCQESWFGLCFCNLKPFAAFWRIPDQCL